MDPALNEALEPFAGDRGPKSESPWCSRKDLRRVREGGFIPGVEAISVCKMLG